MNFGGGVLERFLPTNQHTQRKLLNFENWCSREVSKSAKILHFFPQATKAQYLVSIAIFSLAPALGTGIGTYLSESKNEDKKESEHDLVLQILQGKYSQVSL